ncbi:MAG: hypothetical protein KBB50_00440 [Candidatus Pacebacteria bacterium]|nr:hypothetical protein [Candidatus Paceibacterota bacterium]
MDISIIIFCITIAFYLSTSGVLLYVWWKYGKDEKGVALARVVYLTGSLFLFMYMLTF